MAKANITFFHPSEDGSGSALRAEMHYQMDDSPGFIRFSLAGQKDDGFDFQNAVRFDLGVHELSEMLLVLNDEQDMTNGGKPIELGDTLFAMKRIPDEGKYAIAACVRDSDDKRHIVLNKSDAFGLRTSIEGAMFFLAFVKGVNP